MSTNHDEGSALIYVYSTSSVRLNDEYWFKMKRIVVLMEDRTGTTETC